MDAAATPPSPPQVGIEVGVSILGIGFSFSFHFFSSIFSPLFVILYYMDKSFYLKLTFVQRVILPNYGVIMLSTFDLLNSL